MLNDGAGLDTGQVLRVLRLPDDRVDEALLLAHEVRMRWCGPEVEVEGIAAGTRPRRAAAALTRHSGLPTAGM